MCMHYMMDIETHTVIYLRDLLAHPRRAPIPRSPPSSRCWVYEELWHGEAFSDFLRAYGIEVPAEPRLPDGSHADADPPDAHGAVARADGRRAPGSSLAALDARLDDDRATSSPST